MCHIQHLQQEATGSLKRDLVGWPVVRGAVHMPIEAPKDAPTPNPIMTRVAQSFPLVIFAGPSTLVRPQQVPCMDRAEVE